ncbi:MAG: hypothetical protein FWH07_03310 [Oscillospiraceae bacterium]|nr:hypothetical protein [Oscillospiraceae bacterium]
MGKYFLFGLLIFVLGVVLLGCANRMALDVDLETAEYEIGMEMIQNTAYIKAMTGVEKILMFERYDNGSFLNGDSSHGKYTSIDEMLSLFKEYDCKISRFAVIRLGGDDVPTVVIELSLANERYILRYEDGVVFGFHFPFRGLNNLKQDGSYTASGGVGDTRFYRLSFLNGICNPESLSLSFDEFNKVDDAVWYEIDFEHLLFLW